MAKYKFVTASHTTYDEKKTVEILSRSEVETIAEEAAEGAVSNFARKLSSQDRKIAKAAEQAAAATADATRAREAVERLVETARETFRDVITELLAPHYRYLEEHLGIKPPDCENGNAKPSSKPEKCFISARSATKNAPDKSQHAKGATDADEVESEGKTKRRASKVAQKKAKSPQSKRVALQKKEVPAKSSAKSKGAKPCRKK